MWSRLPPIRPLRLRPLSPRSNSYGATGQEPDARASCIRFLSCIRLRGGSLFDGCRPKDPSALVLQVFVPVPCPPAVILPLCPGKIRTPKTEFRFRGSLCAGHFARAGPGPVAAACPGFRTAGRPPRPPGPTHSRAPRQSGACRASVPVRAPAWVECARPGCRYTSGRCIRAIRCSPKR